MLTGAVVKWNKEQPRKIITCNLQVKYRRYYMNICIFGASPEALARIKKDLYKIAYRQITKYIPKLLTYDEFLEQNRVHKTYKCYVRGCNNVGEYDCHTLDGGIYSVCEKHGEMWDKYCMYIQYYYRDIAANYIAKELEEKEKRDR